MPDRPPQTPPPVTLEDLLRLKRSERPAPEFWAEFERTLRQKQLAALVEKKSWWHSVAAAYGRFGRVGLPLGAAAIVAVTFLSTRNHFRAQSELDVADGARRAFVPASTTLSAPEAVGKTEVVAALPPAAPRPVEAPVSANLDKSATLAAADASRRSVTPISWLDDVGDDRSTRADQPAEERSLAVNLDAVSQGGPDLVDAVSHPFGFEERAMPVVHLQHAAEILPTAAAVTEPRRERLLASLGSAGVYAPEPAAPEHARRSVLRYLSEDGWDRSMSRLEAEGDKLSIKF